MKGWTRDRVSLEYGLPSRTILLNWLAQYRKTGILLLRKQEGEYLKWDVNGRKTWEEMTELERLQEENERLRTEVAYLKKLKELEDRDKPYSKKGRDN